MFNILQQLIILFPIIIIGLTVIILIIEIAYFRNYFVSAVLTILGLCLSFFSLFLFSLDKFNNTTLLIYFDHFSEIYIGLILIASIVTTIVSYNWLKNYNGYRDEFYLLLLIATIGSMLLSCSNNLVSLFLGMELISLPLFGMLGYTFNQKASLKACVKYTILSITSSSFFLFGMALLYSQTGQLQFLNLSKIIFNLTTNTTLFSIILLSISMMIVGIGFKLSIVPFHLWTADVYQEAPIPVSMFLSVVSKISVFIGVMHLFLYSLLSNYEMIKLLLETISILSIFYGNIIAINQDNIKRILGYSSIVHIGYLLIGLITITSNTIFTIKTVHLYLVGYLLANIGIFSIIIFMSDLFINDNVNLISFYQGLFWHQPLLSFMITVLILSLAGIPITLGFISKIYVIMLSIQSNLNIFSIFLVTGSIIGFIYYLKIIITLYLPPLDNRFLDVNIYDNIFNPSLIISFICALCVLLFGIYPQLLNILF